MTSNFLAPTASELERDWGLAPSTASGRPTSSAATTRRSSAASALGEAAQREAVLARFGLIPSSAKSETARPATTCNARSETAATRSSFKNAFAARQWCIIPAQCLYVPLLRRGRQARRALAHPPRRPLAAQHRRPVGPLGRRDGREVDQLRDADDQLRPASAPRPLPPPTQRQGRSRPRSARRSCSPRKTSTSGSTPRRAERRSTSAPSARTTSTPTRRRRRRGGRRS